MRSCSPLIATGCVLPRPAASKSLTLRASASFAFPLLIGSCISRDRLIVDELKPEFAEVGPKSREPECVSLAWSADGQTLFGGFTDDLVRVWTVMS